MVGFIRAVAPADKLIAAIRNGRQRGVVAVVVGTATADDTAVARAGHHGNDVLVTREVSREVHVVVDRDGTRVGRDAVLPMVEGVACIGYGLQCGDCACREGTRTGHRACANGVDSGCHRVHGGTHLIEEGRIGFALRDSDRARVVGVAVVPTSELIAAVGCGCQGGHVAVVVGTAACHRTCASGADVGGDDVVVLREGGSIGGVARDGDGARVAGVVVLPVGEGPTWAVDSLQGNARACGICAAARDGACTGRCHLGSDGVVDDRRLGEVSRVGGVFGDGEAILRRVADHGAVQLPAVELVATGRRGKQRAGGASGISATAAYRTPAVVVGIDVDGVFGGSL